MFSIFGDLSDGFILRIRDKKRKPFTFLRFRGVTEVGYLLATLKKVKLGDKALKVSLPRKFQWELEREENNVADPQLPQMCVVGPIKKVTDAISFPHAINADLKGLEAHQVKKLEVVSFGASRERLEELSGCVSGSQIFLLSFHHQIFNFFLLIHWLCTYACF